MRPAVFTFEMAQHLSDAAVKMNQTAKIHIKVDTGMGRIGYRDINEAVPEILKISKLPHIEIEGIFTHFARADEAETTPAYVQLEKFQQFISRLEEEGLSIPMKHCSNSAGIILYGLYPSDEVEKEPVALRPVMELKTHISYVKTVEKGTAISYGGTFITEKETKVATIPVGYADGYCRGLSNKGYVLIHGKRAPILGRVCMDQFMVDVTEIQDAKILDEVTLLGRDGKEKITLEELGDLSGRFNYEFACCISKRVPRVYLVSR